MPALTLFVAVFMVPNSHGTHRRSSYIPPHERRRQSPSPFPSSPPHVFHCDHRYKAIIREIYRDGSILQQRMERLLAGSSRLTPNEDEMDWEADSTIYFMPCRSCLVTANQTDGKTRGFEEGLHEYRWRHGQNSQSLHARSPRPDCEEPRGSLID